MAKKEAESSKGTTGSAKKKRLTVRKSHLPNEQNAEGSGAAAVAEQRTETATKKKRPVACIRRHTDKEFRREFPEVFEGLIKKAKDGGVRETRLLLDIGQFGNAKAVKQRGAKSLSAMLLDELKRRQDEREAAMDGTAHCDAVAAAETTQNIKDGAATDGDAEKR